MLRFVQPGLVGLIDGTVSTLAPIFAAAIIAGSRAALLVGLASALGAAISMGMSEALSDDGELGRRRRRPCLTRIFTLPAATKASLWGCDCAPGQRPSPASSL